MLVALLDYADTQHKIQQSSIQERNGHIKEKNDASKFHVWTPLRTRKVTICSHWGKQGEDGETK
jgi:cysteinyl-tRNA synthetase